MKLLLFILAVGSLWVTAGFVSSRKHAQFLRRLASERPAQSFEKFLGQLTHGNFDECVIRAVYDAVVTSLMTACPHFPVQPDDRIDLFRLDQGEVEDIVETVGARCGRSIEANESNPYRGNLTTVSDIIGYVSSQPKLQLNVRDA